PLKPFVYQHFHDYVAGLLTQPEIEAAMDRTCDEFSQAKQYPPPSHVKNPFEAQFLRDFYYDKSSNALFLDRPRDEGRYAFALCVDFFSVEGKSLHNARADLGMIVMACLNIPPEIRYKPENLYLVGIIPGPEEPALERLNHYMRPLISDLV
ncbi:hypothetical protein PHLGIDRAFT_38447, partial [Phlebiopsis gigantea 11061_1 CR5-6]